MKFIFFDGLASPYPNPSLPNWFYFIFLELLTILVETVICYYIGKNWYAQKEGNRAFTFDDAFFLSCMMNIFSALLFIPIWILLGIGM
jgi:hypothetical protein